MRKKWLWALPLVLLALYLAGPSPSKPLYSLKMPTPPVDGRQLESWIAGQEATHHLKPDNEARIVWTNDSLKAPTEYAIVYLHGFSASQKEGDPIHRQIASRFGCNLYLSRLAEHGIDSTDQLLLLTPEAYWASAKQALAIGGRLGKKVILMGTSTGGTLALQLAAAFPDKVDALILLSPNIAINDPFAWILNDPWGLQVARLVKGGNYFTSADNRPIYRQYWNNSYRLEALVSLEELLETTMDKSHFQQVKQPVLLLYYYRDGIHQDSTVKVSAMLTMFDQLGTPGSLKRKAVFPLAGDHVLGSPIKSHDVGGVEKSIDSFMAEVLGLPRK